MVKRGDIRLAALDPTVGAEIKKTRPCVVISPREVHDHLRTVIVAPMTSGSREAGFRVPVKISRRGWARIARAKPGSRQATTREEAWCNS